jgi:hypothetical protein
MGQIFPATMPKGIAAAALVVGGEAAWLQADCAAAIEALAEAGCAILGTELWLLKDGRVQTSFETTNGFAIWCTSCGPLPDEHWDDYVQRSSRIATESIVAFSWPDDACEPPCPVYFNLTWADRDWFRSQPTLQHPF